MKYALSAMALEKVCMTVPVANDAVELAKIVVI